MKSCLVLETRGILTLDAFDTLARRVRGMIRIYPSILLAITCAASLAHHGVLGSVQVIRLCDVNVDLASVPAEHLAFLASSVTERVYIHNVHGCDLVTILDNVKSKWLHISRQNLFSEETQALVRAMESGVECLELYKGVTLDIRVLRKYNGQGKCRRVDCYFDTANRYMEQLSTWAKSKNWRDDGGSVVRKLETENTTEQLNIIQYFRNLIVNTIGSNTQSDVDSE